MVLFLTTATNNADCYLTGEGAVAVARGDSTLADNMLTEVISRDASFETAFLQAQSSWLQGNVDAALDTLREEVATSTPGQRAAMRRELQLLIGEHAEPGRGEALLELLN